MISIHELKEYMLLLVVEEYLKKMATRYANIDGIQKHIMEQIRSIQKDTKVLIDPGAGMEERPEKKLSKSPGNESSDNRFIEALELHKQYFRAEDWLFLKAAASKDLNESSALISMAQNLAPENACFYLFNMGLLQEENKDARALLKILPYFYIHKSEKAIAHFLSLIKLQIHLRMPVNEHSPFKIQRLIEKTGLIYTGRFYLLLHLINTYNPEKILRVIQRLENKRKFEVDIFFLLEGIIHFKTGNFNEAATKFQYCDIDSLPIDDWEKIEYQGMFAIACQSSGNEGKAMLIWESILNINGIEYFGCSVYYEAVIYMCRYYLRIDQVSKAKSILAGLKELTTASMIEEMGGEYYSLLGDISYSEKNYPGALEHFRKANALKPSEILNKKILWLEQAGNKTQE